MFRGLRVSFLSGEGAVRGRLSVFILRRFIVAGINSSASRKGRCRSTLAVLPLGPGGAFRKANLRDDDNPVFIRTSDGSVVRLRTLKQIRDAERSGLGPVSVGRLRAGETADFVPANLLSEPPAGSPADSQGLAAGDELISVSVSTALPDGSVEVERATSADPSRMYALISRAEREGAQVDLEVLSSSGVRSVSLSGVPGQPGSYGVEAPFGAAVPLEGGGWGRASSGAPSVFHAGSSRALREVNSADVSGEGGLRSILASAPPALSDLEGARRRLYGSGSKLQVSEYTEGKVSPVDAALSRGSSPAALDLSSADVEARVAAAVELLAAEGVAVSDHPEMLDRVRYVQNLSRSSWSDRVSSGTVGEGAVVYDAIASVPVSPDGSNLEEIARWVASGRSDSMANHAVRLRSETSALASALASPSPGFSISRTGQGTVVVDTSRADLRAGRSGDDASLPDVSSDAVRNLGYSFGPAVVARDSAGVRVHVGEGFDAGSAERLRESIEKAEAESSGDLSGPGAWEVSPSPDGRGFTLKPRVSSAVPLDTLARRVDSCTRFLGPRYAVVTPVWNYATGRVYNHQTRVPGRLPEMPSEPGSGHGRESSRREGRFDLVSDPAGSMAVSGQMRLDRLERSRGDGPSSSEGSQEVLPAYLRPASPAFRTYDPSGASGTLMLSHDSAGASTPKPFLAAMTREDDPMGRRVLVPSLAVDHSETGSRRVSILPGSYPSSSAAFLDPARRSGSQVPGEALPPTARRRLVDALLGRRRGPSSVSKPPVALSGGSKDGSEPSSSRRWLLDSRAPSTSIGGLVRRSRARSEGGS